MRRNTWFNPFTLFCLLGGTILGILAQYPDEVMMISQGIVEGIVFYLGAVLILNTFTPYPIKPNYKKKIKRGSNHSFRIGSLFINKDSVSNSNDYETRR